MTQTIKVLTVTDLHRVRVLYDQLGKAVESHRPDIVALVGDFLDAGGDNADQLSTAECAKFLSQLQCKEVVFTRGNHEGSNWWEFFTAWQPTGRKLNALHASAFVHGPLVMVGFPCLMGDESNYVDSLRTRDREEFWPRHLSAEPEEWLPGLSRSHGSSLRTLWLMHEPPSGTPLSQPGSAVAGNPEWLQAIESYSPWLTISGHDHRTPRRTGRWHCRVGSTVCVNAGQSDTGPLHYTVITAEFASERPALPRRMTVQVRPTGEKIELPV